MQKIAINATYKAGGGQIPQLVNFIKYFSDQSGRFICIIYITKHNLYLLDGIKIKKNTKVVISRIADISTFIRILWEQFILPIILFLDKIDILFSPGNISPIFTNVKKIQWIGTIGPFWNKMYELEIPIEKMKFKFNKIFIYITAQYADAVIFESNFTRDLFVKHYNIKPNKSHVIKAGRDNYFFPNINEQILNKYNIYNDFILCVSHLYPYKNIIRLIEAYSIAREELLIETTLVIAGSSYSKEYDKYISDKVENLGIGEYVNFVGNVNRKDLRTFYSACHFLVFPSPCENFAYTLAEAMSCGSPIISSNTTAMPETCEDAAIYFNPYDLNQISEKLILVANDNKLRNLLQKRALKRVKKLKDYKQVSMKTIEIMESTINP